MSSVSHFGKVALAIFRVNDYGRGLGNSYIALTTARLAKTLENTEDLMQPHPESQSHMKFYVLLNKI
jgi:hypothetical protein